MSGPLVAVDKWVSLEMEEQRTTAFSASDENRDPYHQRWLSAGRSQIPTPQDLEYRLRRRWLWQL